MTGWILCAPRIGDKARDKEMKWLTLCYPGNTAETDKWNLFAPEVPIEGAKLHSPPGFLRADLKYEEGKLIIVNLDRDVPEKEFLALFGEYGEVASHKLQVDFNSGLRNGKAWIKFKTHKQAIAAMVNLDGKSLNDRSIEIKQCLKKGCYPPTDFKNHPRKRSSSFETEEPRRQQPLKLQDSHKGSAMSPALEKVTSVPADPKPDKKEESNRIEMTEEDK